MDKQEKISKFISLYLRQRFTTDEMPENECDSETKFILRYLHDNDVVIKVERELPERTYNAEFYTAQQDMLKAGYVAVEPLIQIV